MGHFICILTLMCFKKMKVFLSSFRHVSLNKNLSGVALNFVSTFRTSLPLVIRRECSDVIQVIILEKTVEGGDLHREISRDEKTRPVMNGVVYLPPTCNTQGNLSLMEIQWQIQQTCWNSFAGSFKSQLIDYFRGHIVSWESLCSFMLIRTKWHFMNSMTSFWMYIRT